MLLTLQKWPPIASHMGCILLGMAFAYLSKEVPESRFISKGRLLVTLSQASFSKEFLHKKYVGESFVLYYLGDNSRGQPCVYKDIEGRLESIEPWGQLSFKEDIFSAYWQKVRGQKRFYKFVRKGNGFSHVQCQKAPKVVYGSY